MKDKDFQELASSEIVEPGISLYERAKCHFTQTRSLYINKDKGKKVSQTKKQTNTTGKKKIIKKGVKKGAKEGEKKPK